MTTLHVLIRRNLIVSCLPILCSLSVGLAQTTTQTQQAPAAAQSNMTVDDVIKMVQVKLGDDLIISQIRRNGKPFSLSADEMVRLKTMGASDDVIRVLIDPQARIPSSSPERAVATTSTTPSLPSSYGYYILDGTTLSELGQAQVITKFGLTLADRGFAVDGLTGEQALLKVESQSPTIIVYQQNVSPSALQLGALSFVHSMTASQFNIINTAPQFFSSLYRKNPNDTILLDLWRADRAVQMRVEPIEGKTGMYKLVPSTQLDVGKYALYFADALHGSNIVFSASVGRQSTVLAFEVVPGSSPAEPITDAAPESARTPVSAPLPVPPVALMDPAKLTAQAPASFKAKFTTTKGDFIVEVHRDWSPRGADRFFNLVENGFFNDASFYRVVPNFIVQFGIAANPEVSRAWQSAKIRDDSRRHSNATGTLVFAATGANTRTTQMFINLVDNTSLDAQRGVSYSPFGEVIQGMDVVRSLYSEYGENSDVGGKGPAQGRVQNEGKPYLDKYFPKLDCIKSATVLP